MDLKNKKGELIKTEPELEKSLDYFKTIADSIKKNIILSSKVIKGILNFARTSQKDIHFSQFSINDVIDQGTELLKIKHQLTSFPLVVEINGSDNIFGVKAQIQECIYNSLDNAFEAIREKLDFHLTEEEKRTFRPDIKLKLTQRENDTLIEITDNGIGIKDDNRKKIFAPFFTTKPSSKSGSGIGVYVVKKMIEENHKGKIWFNSEFLKGTTFTIELPQKRSQSQ
jgi:signal transduction histidine kinase